MKPAFNGDWGTNNGTGWVNPVSSASYGRLNLHVGASDADVVRAVSRKMFVQRYRFSPHHRRARKAMYRGYIAHHATARQVYRAVMTGDFS